MRELTLLRHAHAERPKDGVEDFERELDRRGRRDARHVAAHLADLGYRPDHLITSPAARAVETAKIVARAVGFELAKIRHDDRTYLAEADLLLAIVRCAPAGARRVLLVGHNPGLSTLAGRLDAKEDIGELPTAAAYTLRFAGSDWGSLEWRTGKRVRYVTPDDVEQAP